VPTDVVAANLDTYTYDGRPVLGWWQGVVTATGEIDSGEIKLVDQHYRPVASLKGADGWVITLHALAIKDDKAWVTANRNVPADLSDAGGVNHGVLTDSALQEYDLKTGRLLYTWRASQHIPYGDSETQPPPNGFPWDAYHINSLQLVGAGQALVSMRNTSAAYLFDLDTGKIVWQLGGKKSSFALPSNGTFSWQHDVSLSGDTVTLFDNDCCEITGAGEYLPSPKASRGLKLQLDTGARSAKVVATYSHGATFHSEYMGNVQPLDDGSVFVGWGQVPFISRFSASGKLEFDGAFPGPDMTYRAWVRKWVGQPLTPPRAVAVKGGVAVSWNGATEVKQWRVAGAGTVPKRGFETRIPVDGGTVRVQALDASGKVLGTSNQVKTEG
jgi:hypothetical protein